MRLSIALCTCEGAAFLGEQLASFTAQTRRPDEIVVCDDASTDATPAIVSAFARSAPCEVRLEVNRERLGVAGNFTQAMARCTGDVIFPADQDDVWAAEKLAVMEAAFTDHPRAGLVFGDLEITDDRLRPMGYTALEALGFGPAQRRAVEGGRAFDLLIRYNVVSGAAAAFRTRFRDLILPVPACWNHDEWLALVLSAVTEVHLIPRVMARYRQHGEQQVGLRRLNWAGQYRKAWAMGRPYFQRMVERSEAALNRLRQSPHPLRDPDILPVLGRKLAHARRRLKMRQSGIGRWPRVAAASWRGDYRRFDYGWKSALQDLFMP
jgi:glycosyltransferase involved in cell wall biosynthesis